MFILKKRFIEIETKSGQIYLSILTFHFRELSDQFIDIFCARCTSIVRTNAYLTKLIIISYRLLFVTFSFVTYKIETDRHTLESVKYFYINCKSIVSTRYI